MDSSRRSSAPSPSARRPHRRWSRTPQDSRLFRAGASPSKRLPPAFFSVNPSAGAPLYVQLTEQIKRPSPSAHWIPVNAFRR